MPPVTSVVAAEVIAGRKATNDRTIAKSKVRCVFCFFINSLLHCILIGNENAYTLLQSILENRTACTLDYLC